MPAPYHATTRDRDRHEAEAVLEHFDGVLPETQFALIDRLVDATAADRRHRISMSDTAMEPGVALSYSGVRYVLAPETPASLFAALPVALAHGYPTLVLAHERSANAGNLIWPATGEEVNHQWGKSLEAERLLATTPPAARPGHGVPGRDGAGGQRPPPRPLSPGVGRPPPPPAMAPGATFFHARALDARRFATYVLGTGVAST